MITWKVFGKKALIMACTVSLLEPDTTPSIYFGRNVSRSSVTPSNGFTRSICSKALIFSVQGTGFPLPLDSAEIG